jgi:serine protease Do
MRHLSKFCLVSGGIRRPVLVFVSGLFTALAVIAATPGVAQAEVGSGAEAIFADARQWTVEVSTNIDAAFNEDVGGAGKGTGFLVDANRGWIITNAHVAGHSPSELTVKWADGQTSKATAIYVDPHVDTAILAVDPLEARKHQPARLACSPAPGAGHPVGVLGHPIGFRYNASRGIVSGATSRFGQDLILMDAAVNHGNSGGPVFSLESGAVIGIATLAMNSEEVHGITLAVPIRFPCRIVQLLAAGKDPSPPDPRLAFAMNVDNEMTLSVAANFLPPGNIPLQSGDEVLAVGQPAIKVHTYTELIDALRGHGDIATLVVRRKGTEKTVTGTLPAAPQITRRRGILLSGALLAPSSAEYAPWWAFQRPVLAVEDVAGGSGADEAGFYVGDIIMNIEGQPIDSFAAVAEAAQRATEEQRELDVLVLRLVDTEADRKATFHRLKLEDPETELVGAGDATKTSKATKKAAR